jgi:hypothetical protein
MEDASIIELEKKYEKAFSICTLVTNNDEYQLMKESFVQQGFDEGCEYLVADNIGVNKFNAYQAIRRFLKEAAGEYIIIVHQDVRCNDDIVKLKTILEKLQQKDKNWAICGNAGAGGYKQLYYHLDNNGDIKKSKNLPARVYSLDENLLIIKNSAGLTISSDLENFHLYGTDLCIIADFLGYSCYVIDFMVTHLSKGNLGQLEKYVPGFIEAYSHKLRERFVQTTCTKFYIGGSKISNNVINSAPVFFWVKAWQRLRNNFSK